MPLQDLRQGRRTTQGERRRQRCRAGGRAYGRRSPSPSDKDGGRLVHKAGAARPVQVRCGRRGSRRAPARRAAVPGSSCPRGNGCPPGRWHRGASRPVTRSRRPTGHEGRLREAEGLERNGRGGPPAPRNPHQPRASRSCRGRRSGSAPARGQGRGAGAKMDRERQQADRRHKTSEIMTRVTRRAPVSILARTTRAGPSAQRVRVDTTLGARRRRDLYLLLRPVRGGCGGRCGGGRGCGGRSGRSWGWRRGGR